MGPLTDRSKTYERDDLQTLEELAAQYYTDSLAVRGVMEETARDEHVYVWRFFAWFGPPANPAALFGAITPDSITQCLSAYAAAHSFASRRWMQRVVRSFLRFAHVRGYLPMDWTCFSPSVRVRRMGKVLRAIPQECIEGLMAGMNGDGPADLRDRAILVLLCTYGVRGVQVRQLRQEHLDWSGRRIHFPAAKRGRRIEQYLTDEVGNSILAYLRRGRPDCSCPEVFVSTRAPFCALKKSKQLSGIIRRRLKKAGITLPTGVLYGSHAFRHAFASRFYGRVPFKDIVDMLGHQSPSSTLMYGKVDQAALAQAALPWPGGAL